MAKFKTLWGCKYCGKHIPTDGRTHWLRHERICDSEECRTIKSIERPKPPENMWSGGRAITVPRVKVRQEDDDYLPQK